MPPGIYIISTIVHTNEKCTEFFDMLEKFKQDSKMFSKVITAAQASGSPLIALATASGATVAQFGSALAFGDSINTGYAEIYTFSEYKDPLKRLIFEVMADYQRKKGIDLFFERQVGVTQIEIVSGTNAITANQTSGPVMDLDSPTTVLLLPVGPDPADKTKTLFDKITVNKIKLAQFATSKLDPRDMSPNLELLAANSLIARNIGVEYASLCSLASMKQIISDALAKAKGEVNSGGTGAPASAKTGPATPPTK